MTVPSQDQIERYREDGVVLLPGAFESAWLDELAAGIDRVMARPGALASDYAPAGGEGRFFGELMTWVREPGFRAFVFRSRAAAISAALMGSPTVDFYHDHVLVKHPGTVEPTPWHHDQPYHPVDGDMLCALWLALDPIARGNGLEFVRGSHRWGRLFAPRYFVDGRPYYRNQPGFEQVPDIDAERDKHDILDWDLEPGDCLAFHVRVLHAAPGNVARHRRRAYVTRWLGADAVAARRPGLVSPPIDYQAHPPGTRLEGPLYPRIWPRRRNEEAA